MEVTEAGIVTDVNSQHPEKAPNPMKVIESGIVTDVNPTHIAKA